MILKFFKICTILLSFVFLTGFVAIPAIVGPAFTVATSGNFFKAGVQLAIDNEFKKKTGKSSFSYLKEEVQNNSHENQLNEEFKNLVEQRVKTVHQKLVDQNNLSRDFKLLVEKRVRLTHKKLNFQKINR